MPILTNMEAMGDWRDLLAIPQFGTTEATGDSSTTMSYQVDCPAKVNQKEPLKIGNGCVL